MRRILGLAALAGALAAGTQFAGSTSAHAQIEEKKFNVIGTWNFINNWKKIEQPFWSEMIGKNTGGKITANIKSVTEVNLKGTEVLRLLKTGVYDIAAALPIYVDDGGAIIEASDLSGVAQSIPMQKEILELWLPEMQKVMKERYNSQIMSTFAYPQQTFFCRDEISSIADLKGKKIRVQGVSQSDLAKALGASTVTIPFGEVVPALEKGVVDCGITGTMPGYQAKWTEVTKSIITLPLGYTAAFWAVNLTTWNKLNPDTQAAMTAEFKKLADLSWATVEAESAEGIACLTGVGGPCSAGPAAKLKLVKPSEADVAARTKALNESVLPEWAKRCGPECAAKWTETVGKKFGLVAKAN
jgi:TRAP-type C4-dicarboxylate transport system substrate-binding protein